MSFLACAIVSASTVRFSNRLFKPCDLSQVEACPVMDFLTISISCCCLALASSLSACTSASLSALLIFWFTVLFAVSFESSLLSDFSYTAASSLKPAVFASDLSVFASCFFEAVLVFFVCASSFAVTLCAATAETTLEIASNISHPSLVMCVRESFPAILLSPCIASDIAKQFISYTVYRLFCVCCL